jgi:hypothetical protein
MDVVEWVTAILLVRPLVAGARELSLAWSGVRVAEFSFDGGRELSRLRSGVL